MPDRCGGANICFAVYCGSRVFKESMRVQYIHVYIYNAIGNSIIAIDFAHASISVLILNGIHQIKYSRSINFPRCRRTKKKKQKTYMYKPFSAMFVHKNCRHPAQSSNKSKNDASSASRGGVKKCFRPLPTYTPLTFLCRKRISAPGAAEAR